MNWDDARLFLAAHRHRSLLAAAEALGVSHTTVRRRLDRLEAASGAKLFASTSRGLVATDASQAILAAAEAMEAAAFRLESELQGASRLLSGAVTVTTVDVAAPLLAKGLQTLVTQHPSVEVTLNTDNRLLDLHRREADIAVRFTNSPDERLFGRKLAQLNYAPFAASQADPQCWILWDEAAGAVATEAWWRRNAAETRVIRVSQGAAMIALAKAGLGAVIIPTAIGLSAGLQQIGPFIEGFETQVWALCDPRLRYSRRIRTAMQCLADGLAP